MSYLPKMYSSETGHRPVVELKTSLQQLEYRDIPMFVVTCLFLEFDWMAILGLASNWSSSLRFSVSFFISLSSTLDVSLALAPLTLVHFNRNYCAMCAPKFM